jgi:hypothetical protein
MVEFSSWHDRLKSAGGIIPRRIRYTRKSTESMDRQIASHDQQMSEMDREWGEIDHVWWWSESRSGTSFDREVLNDLKGFCRAHPQDPSHGYRVELHDPSRFGRPLGRDGKPDVLSFLALYSEFESTGWQLHFITATRTGNQLGDIIMMAIYAYAAAVYSATLSVNASRGRRSEAANGWWTGGVAPWGTLRHDTKTRRDLGDRERSTPGGGGTILKPVEEILTYWAFAAQRVIDGASFEVVSNELLAKGVRGPRAGALGHRAVKNWLTNPVFIGEVEYTDRQAEGGKVRADAKWGPMVDRDLFRRVNVEIERREGDPRNLRRAVTGTTLLRPICAGCGAEYHGGRYSAYQDHRRTYVHPVLNEYRHGERYLDSVEQGCRQFSFPADELEEAIKDLILRERSSFDYEEEVRAVLMERENFKHNAVAAVEAAERVATSLTLEYRRRSKAASDAAAQGLDVEPFYEELKAVQQRKQAAEAEVEKARAFAESRDIAWQGISAAIHESRDLAATWERVGADERRVLLDYWVLSVAIVVEPIPGKKRANKKTAVVNLRSAPEVPLYFTFAEPALRASSSSSRTQGSSSTSSRPASACVAPAETILPSAQAECPRTSGSSSHSACANTGTASGDAQLPKATATFRKKPRRLARLTGEPLKRRANSSCDIDISSTSDASCTPGLGRNAGSDDGTENLRGNGHTSWQMSQP